MQEFRQGPADTGEHAGQAEEVRQVEGEDHDQVANGDHLKVAVGAVARPQRAPHADEGDQQRGLYSLDLQEGLAVRTRCCLCWAVGGHLCLSPFPKKLVSYLGALDRRSCIALREEKLLVRYT